MIGGSNAAQNQIPGMLGLSTAEKNNYGGAILLSQGGPGPALALTAAHCLKYDLNTVTVRGGSLQWDSGGHEAKVKEYFVNPHYALPEGIDLAVLVLDRQLPQVATAPPLAGAADAAYYTPGNDVTMAGWGPAKLNGLNPPCLQAVTLPLTDPATCPTEDRASNADFACCRPQDGRESTAGDSGGPVIGHGGNGARLLAVIEGGSAGASIATRVDRQLAWINQPQSVHSYVVDSDPRGVAVTAGNGHRYVAHGTQGRTGKVTVFDANWTYLRRIDVGPVPTAVIASPNGSRVYVASSGDRTVSEIDTQHDTVLRTARLDNGGMTTLAITSDGARLFVANGDSVTFVDTATMQPGHTATFTYAPSAIAVAPNNGRIYVAFGSDGDLQVVDTVTHSVTAWDTGEFANTSVLAAANRVYVGSTGRQVHILDDRGAQVDTIETAADTAVKALALSGAELHVGYETTNSTNLAQVGVQVFSTQAPYALNRTLQLGGASLASLVATPAGGILAVNKEVSSVSVVRP
jgi:DNA-binding beta-propeller fold protein YncE